MRLPALLTALVGGAAPAWGQLGPVPGVPAVSVGQPNGVAALDANGRASGLVVLPTGASTPRSLASRAGDTVNVLDYGAACDGVANDRAAINAAIAAAAARANGGQVYFPRMCRSDASTGPVTALSNVTLRGPARGRGGILIDDTNGGGDGVANAGPLSDFHILDMTISGMRATLPTAGVQLVHLTNGNNLSVENSELVQSRQMGMVVQQSNHVVVRGNRVFHTNADGIAVWDDSDVLVTANEIEGANDDAISAHSNDSVAGPVRSGITITENTVTESQGIVVLGAKSATISHNTLRRIMSYGIYVDVSGTVQGDTAVWGVHVTDNTISDVFLRQETPYRDQEQYYIRIGGGPRVAASGGSVPGTPSAGTGAMTPLFGPDGIGAFYANNVKAGGSVPSPGGYWVDVTGNRLTRTLPAVAAYSDWGYNAALFVGNNGPASGFYNGPIPEAALNTTGIKVEPSLRNSRIEGNTVQTTGPYAIYLDQATPINAGDLDGLLIQNNKLIDYQTSGLWVNAGGTAQRIMVRGNEFDGDPRFVSPNRGPHGTWTTLSGAGDVPEGALVGASGMVFVGNSFRNLAQPVVNNVPYPSVARANLIYGRPSAVGASTANAGVGVLPVDSPEFGYLIEDSDPASSTYGQMLSGTASSAAAQPASGTYVAGHIVYNAAASGSGGAAVIGWLRLTTGSGNAAGVDWVPIASAAGVPASVPLTISVGSGTLGSGASATLSYVKTGPLTVSYQITLSVPSLGTAPAGSSISLAGFPFQVAAGGCNLLGRENAVTGKTVLLTMGNGGTGGAMFYYDNSSPLAAGINLTAGAVCQTYN